ncbi:MAG: pseudoazurin [Rubellimicrobium sp.]|nr:pseudoazurin [Rubellimicrobium sp.]
MTFAIRAAALALIAAAAAGPALAAEHEVQMLNRGEAGPMVFEPAFVQAEPGDVIRFVPVDRGHNVESIEGLLPEGVDAFKGDIDAPYELTVTEEGVYGVKCTPHFGMGMVMLIEVGEGDLSQVGEVRLPRKAAERMETIIAGVG